MEPKCRHIIVIVINVICHGSVIVLSSLSTVVGRVESAILQEIAQPIEHIVYTVFIDQRPVSIDYKYS